MRRLALLLLLLLAAGAARAGSVLQVLCYHRFAPACGKDPYCVSDADLAAQLDWLKAEGWQSVGLSQVARALDGAEALPARSVMLSVDDGYKAGARGAEAFEARGFRGVFFVNPGSLARGKRKAHSPFMTAEDLRDLEARGHSVGSHSVSHPNLGKVPAGQGPQAYAAWVGHELKDARVQLEGLLGHPVQDLAWPYGAYNNALVGAAEAAGYRRLYTVTEAAVELPGADRERLPRFLLAGRVPMASFKRRFAAQRFAPSLGGLADGAWVDAASLPLRLPGAQGLQLDGKPLPCDADGCSIASARNGFHFLIQAGSQPPRRLMFQIAPAAWQAHFNALSKPQDPEESHAP